MADDRGPQFRSGSSTLSSFSDNSDGGIEVNDVILGDRRVIARTQSVSSMHSLESQAIILPQLGLEDGSTKHISMTSRDLLVPTDKHGPSNGCSLGRRDATLLWARDHNTAEMKMNRQGTAQWSQNHNTSNIRRRPATVSNHWNDGSHSQIMTPWLARPFVLGLQDDEPRPSNVIGAVTPSNPLITSPIKSATSSLSRLSDISNHGLTSLSSPWNVSSGSETRRQSGLHYYPENAFMQTHGLTNLPNGYTDAHMRTMSTDSGFALPQPLKLAEIVRSGATEDIDRLNHGIIGPFLGSVRQGAWTALPPKDVAPVHPPEGPMPPPVPGYNGVARPRFGKAQSRGSCVPQTPHGHNINGPTAAYSGVRMEIQPVWLAAAFAGRYLPTVGEVNQVLPFCEAYRFAAPMTAAVVKVRFPPYTTTRGEILAFFGQSSQVCRQPPGSPFHAIHIITDRYDGKTMDAYIEITSERGAELALQNFQKRMKGGKPLKIKDRSCVAMMATQQELMEELLPRGKFIGWDGSAPKVSSRVPYFYPDVPSTGFDGFLDPEELAMMAKYAETPRRSPYVERCPIRVYESLISVLHKYPWFSPEHILMRERDALFDVTATSIRALICLLSKTSNNVRGDQEMPTPATLKELVVTALTCPGFSESQKAIVVSNVVQAGWGEFTSSRGMNLRFGGIHKFASNWPFKALSRVPGTSDYLVDYVATLFQKTIANTNAIALREMQHFRMPGADKIAFAGIKIDYDGAKTLAEVARIELRYVEVMLRSVLRATR